MEPSDTGTSLLFLGASGVVVAIVLGGLLRVVRAPDRVVEAVVATLITLSVVASAAGVMFRIFG